MFSAVIVFAAIEPVKLPVTARSEWLLSTEPSASSSEPIALGAICPAVMLSGVIFAPVYRRLQVGLAVGDSSISYGTVSDQSAQCCWCDGVSGNAVSHL